MSLAVLSIPGDMLRSVVENVANKMQCVIHERFVCPMYNVTTRFEREVPFFGSLSRCPQAQLLDAQMYRSQKENNPR
ncbi:hypothetical protein AVEN_85542-1 [Araneus ventricosus]|uniref:Uncharacterized protein n=1 Tax=Araneus ventricosus TaxID=182803 RepID=A0A4Y2LLY5_ARAVE|nr:hypothetical protein AVEN_85542-1 [Araneus ventricosus]